MECRVCHEEVPTMVCVSCRNNEVTQWTPWAYKVASKLYKTKWWVRRYGQYDDIKQDSVMGLMRASDKYDPTRQDASNFQTFSGHVIYRYIEKRAVRLGIIKTNSTAFHDPNNKNHEQSRKAFSSYSGTHNSRDSGKPNPRSLTPGYSSEHINESERYLPTKEDRAIDVRVAMADLKHVETAKHYFGFEGRALTFREMAELDGTSYQAQQMRVSRFLDSMREKLGYNYVGD